MGSILTTPVTGAVAWRGADLQRDGSWIEHLTPAALAELDAALRAVQAKGLQLEQVTRDDFPLPAFARDIARINDELENGRGFVLLRGLPRERYSDDELAILYWGIGAHMGSAVSQNSRGDLLGHVRDRGFDFSRLDVRGYETRASQGLHVDNSDVVGLLCLRAAKSGGTSQLVSSMTIHNELLARHPWYLGLLYRPFAVDMRGEGRPGVPDFYTRPVYSYYDGKLSCGVNFTYIKSAPAKSGVPLSAVELEALDVMERLSQSRQLCLHMTFEPGDIQFVNNYVILHDRMPYEDWDEPEKKRHLLRLWLAVSNGRSLAPDFASRYHARPGIDDLRGRGGVPVHRAPLVEA